MKNKILALLATVGLVASASAVEINDNLSINGFIDGSYSNLDNGGAATGDTESQDLGIDEVELNFLINVGNVSGVINFDAQGDPTSDQTLNLEQAHITYNINDSVSVTFGRYGSALGLEKEDPAGLYTITRAYSDGYRNAGNTGTGTVNQGSSFNFADLDSLGQVDGVTIAYAGDTFSVAASLENASNNEASALQTSDLDVELSFSFTGIENTTIGGGFFFDNEQATSDTETDAVNVHASTQVGKLLLGAEYSVLDTQPTVLLEKLTTKETRI